MPADDASVELQDLGLQCPQLTAESSKTRTGHLGETVVGYSAQNSAVLIKRAKFPACTGHDIIPKTDMRGHERNVC